MSPLTPDTIKLLKDFNRNIEWLKAQTLKDKPEAWLSHEEACKILNRSTQWYQYRRMGFTDSRGYHCPILANGTDWRRVGGRIEYRQESILSLKNSLIHAS